MSDESMAALMAQFVTEHTELYLSNPTAAHIRNFSALGDPNSYPTLLLTTTGRRSGEPRHSPLIYKKIGDEYAIVASKAGAPTHPAWFLNLQQTPQCCLRVGADSFAATTRQASGAEYNEAWQQMVDLFPGYAQYAEITEGRTIPIVLCRRG